MDIQNKNTKMFHLYQEDIFNCEQTRDIQRKSKIQGGFQIRIKGDGHEIMLFSFFCICDIRKLCPAKPA
jgi:hypothetical protein